MNIRSLFFPVLVCLMALCTVSCHDRIDLTADYKDISFSYSLMNINDSVHYFKVYRGYLTDENAYVAASDWNNIYYPVDSIEVRLEEYRNNQLVRSAVLDTTTAMDKEPGYFANPKQMLYYSTWKLNEEATYRLVVKHKNTGKEVYAETPIVGDFSVRRPTSNWNMNLDQAFKIQFYAANNASAYDIFMYFYYIEVDNVTGEITHKKLMKKLNSDLIRDNSTVSGSGREISYNQFTPSTFYTFLAQNIEPNSRVTRYIDAVDNNPYYCISLHVWAASKEFVTYRDVATPNSSIVQTRLEYTNFVSDDNDAYGLLASRNHTVRNLKFDNLNHNEDTLVKGVVTKGLNFDYYRNSPLFQEER